MLDIDVLGTVLPRDDFGNTDDADDLKENAAGNQAALEDFGCVGVDGKAEDAADRGKDALGNEAETAVGGGINDCK